MIITLGTILIMKNYIQTQLQSLIIEICDENQEAFSKFYQLTVEKVYSLAFRILGNQSDSEDVVSDVYLQAWQQVSEYKEDKGSVIGWLLLITRSRALDAYRRNKTKMKMLLSEANSLSAENDPSQDLEEIVNLFQESVKVNKCLTDMSLVQRQALSLAFFRGYSHSEISDALDIPLGSVKSNIRRGLSSMQVGFYGR